MNTSVDVTAVSGSNDGREHNGRFRLMAFIEDGLAAEQIVPQLSLGKSVYVLASRPVNVLTQFFNIYLEYNKNEHDYHRL